MRRKYQRGNLKAIEMFENREKLRKAAKAKKKKKKKCRSRWRRGGHRASVGVGVGGIVSLIQKSSQPHVTQRNGRRALMKTSGEYIASLSSLMNVTCRKPRQRRNT